MSHAVSSLAAFHRVGDRSRLHPVEMSSPELQPVLFSYYRDLTRLRYDYPVILVDSPAPGGWVQSLTGLIDELLRKIAPPGASGEELRQQVLALEACMRDLIACGHQGSLSGLVECASQRLHESYKPPGSNSSNSTLSNNLQRTTQAIEIDGEVIDCVEDIAIRMINHAWAASEELKAGQLRNRIVRLIQKLKDILQADFMNSATAREPGKLASTMGTANQSVFDFDAMARVLKTAPVAKPLPKSRRDRIRQAISVLESQRFIALPQENQSTDTAPFEFAFSDPKKALSAYRERLPLMAELVRAISIAQLEIENRYVADEHDGFFDRFDESRLGPSDIVPLPGYLLSIDKLDERNLHSVLEILRAGLPFKIITQSTDILENDSVDGTRLSFGTRGQQLARMVVGLDRVFVLQASSAALYRLRHSIFEGLACDRPSLFSIYSGQHSKKSGKPDQESGNSRYLQTAAATESRLFPSLVYNPAAGQQQADRFDITDNPQTSRDWTVHELSFEDSDRSQQVEPVEFTAIDFIASHPDFIDRFVCIPPGDWDEDMIPIHRYLGLTAKQRAKNVPYVLLADREGTLQRAIVDTLLIDAAERCNDAWRSLQELGGIHNSHANRALAKAEQAWIAEQKALEAHSQATVVTDESLQQPAEKQPVISATATRTAEPVQDDDQQPASDEPWIETIRCTTCNECTQINDRMFAYNEDQRAYVADADAGTFRELVEAAETCQVAIIHPGKPRNPDEPGLDELLVRAEPFNT